MNKEELKQAFLQAWDNAAWTQLTELDVARQTVKTAGVSRANREAVARNLVKSVMGEKALEPAPQIDPASLRTTRIRRVAGDAANQLWKLAGVAIDRDRVVACVEKSQDLTPLTGQDIEDIEEEIARTQARKDSEARSATGPHTKWTDSDPRG